GLDAIGGKDWYAWGSAVLLKSQKADGSWQGEYSQGGVDTCFALLFLRRSDLIGERRGQWSERQDRMLRWSMSFNSRNGNDYAHQLARLGAMIAVPAGKDYRLYKDLQKTPVKGEITDLSAINRIYWL